MTNITVQPLIDFVTAFARCPCCCEIAVCDPECSYREDMVKGRASYENYERMVWARETMAAAGILEAEG